MKWNKKGHEFDALYDELVSSMANKALYFWGAGIIGRRLYQGLSENCDFKIAGFIDNDRRKQSEQLIEGVRVFSVQRLVESSETSIVILTMGKEKMPRIKEQMRELGLLERFRLVDYRTFLSVYYNCYRGITYLGAVNFSLTQKCTLNCKYCSVLTPIIKEKKHYLLDEMKKDADIFFKAVDLVESFTLVGGEPLFYPDIVEFIAYVMDKYQNKVLSAWNIITNGTIIPSEEVLDCIKKYNGEIQISDYSVTLKNIEKSIEQLTVKLKEKGIPYTIYKADQWIDFGYGNSSKEDWTEERLITFFDQCQTPCRLVKDRGVYYCANSKMAIIAGLNDKDSANFYDLSHFKREDTRALMEFDLGYSEPGYLSMCKRCNGYLTINQQYIPVAEQEERRENEVDK